MGQMEPHIKWHFSIYDFLRRSRKKKTSIDGLKWRDLVMGRWRLVNFKVSAVRCPVSQRVSCVKLRKAAVAM